LISSSEKVTYRLAQRPGSYVLLKYVVEVIANRQGRLPVDVAHEHGKGTHVSYLKSVGPPVASKRNVGEA
jgi:hypothetical protein